MWQSRCTANVRPRDVAPVTLRFNGDARVIFEVCQPIRFLS